MEESKIEKSAMAGDLEARCNIDLDTAEEEATWYSVMNIMSLCLGSGMGIPMDEAEINSLLGGVGLCPDDMPISNPSLLKAFFKNGDPHLMKPFQQNDFSTWRWSPDSFDKELVPQAQGWTIIAETECAKWFGIPEKTESIPFDFRKQWMSHGLLLCVLAREQCDFAFDNLRSNRGLFVKAAEPGSVKITDGEANLEDQACMLWACSNLAMLAGRSGSVFEDEGACRRFIQCADELFEAVVDNKDALVNASVNKVQAKSVAIPALAWYACATDAQDLKARCLWLLREFADDLVRAQDSNEMVGNTLVDAACALRALVEAFRVTRLRTYADSAVGVFNFIESQWWKLPGIYSQTPLAAEYTYNADNVGLIIGALNASRLFLKDRINRSLDELRMRIFFCNTVNMSGLQISMPSMDFLPGWLQQREPSMHFRHNSLPLPSEAGNQFGIAPVFAGEISYDPKSDVWSRKLLFDAQAAMRACCEFIWLNNEAVNGFPQIKLEEAPIAVREAAGMKAEGI